MQTHQHYSPFPTIRSPVQLRPGQRAIFRKHRHKVEEEKRQADLPSWYSILNDEERPRRSCWDLCEEGALPSCSWKLEPGPCHGSCGKHEVLLVDNKSQLLVVEYRTERGHGWETARHSRYRR